MAKSTEEFIFLPPTDVGEAWIIRTPWNQVLGRGAILRWAMWDAVTREKLTGSTAQERMWAKLRVAWNKQAKELGKASEELLSRHLQRLGLEDEILLHQVPPDPSGLPQMVLIGNRGRAVPVRSDLLATALSKIPTKGSDPYEQVFHWAEMTDYFGRAIAWPPGYALEQIGFGPEQAMVPEITLRYVQLFPNNDGTVRAVGGEFDLRCDYTVLTTKLNRVSSGDWESLVEALYSASI